MRLPSFLLFLLIPALSSAQSQIAPAPHPPLVTADEPEPAREKERFDVLPIAPNTLKAIAPILGEKSSAPTYTRELWRVQWRANDPIDLYIIKPVGVTKPPAVLFLYSFPTDTDRFRDDTYCKTVTAHGVAAIGFVSALTGQRYHDRPWKEWFVSQMPEALGASVHDVQMVLNYLASRGDLDMDRIGIFGQGSGATIAILAASADRRIQAVDALDAWGDWATWFKESPIVPDHERTTYLTPDFQAHVANFDPVRWLPRIDPHTIRLQQTAFDTVTPADAQSRIRQTLPSTAASIHYASVDDFRSHTIDGKILDWLDGRLTLAQQSILVSPSKMHQP